MLEAACYNSVPLKRIGFPDPLIFQTIKLRIADNMLSGPIDITNLPVLLRHNEFTGESSLEHLPKGLNVLSLSGNQLRGTVCLTSLPVRLHSLDLSENTFLWWLT
ncbi:hypothetical protein XU18_0758 [Perkinsela sp. CCAP 1560/4]|nr:hypothetical protein XU18_0758 [Perkinsela sp. CCAP 1560/4]|eukprot:KNH08794.1 hypothetical protein XU18_0758 [Perkinsela sp. CCAP 1560/4]